MLVSLISLFSLILLQGVINRYISCLVIPLVYLILTSKSNLFYLLVLSFLYEIIYTNHLFLFPFIIFVLYKIKVLFYKNYQYNKFTNILLGILFIFIYNIFIYSYLVISKYQIFNLDIFFRLNLKYILTNITIILLSIFISDIIKGNMHIIKW